jgi:excisionase family DNA binding protein
MNRQQITAPEAARQAGVMLPYLYALVAVGRLKGEKVDGKWQIARADFEAWRKTHRSHRKGHQTTKRGTTARVATTDSSTISSRTYRAELPTCRCPKD